MLILPDDMRKQVREDHEVCFIPEHGKSFLTEILETVAKCNAEGRPIWKPMRMQPLYRANGFDTRKGNGSAATNAYKNGGQIGRDGKALDIGADIFARISCLPSDNKMTEAQVDKTIEVVGAYSK